MTDLPDDKHPAHTHTDTPPLPDALNARSGVVCAVGAGGKKTTLYRLGNSLDRAVVTATVRIPIFDEEVARVAVTADPAFELETNDAWPLGLVPDRDREDRYSGYDPGAIETITSYAPGPVLVKADGARTRLLKAPNEKEPQLPAAADTVLAIASVKAVGRPLEAPHVHRPELVSDITGREVGEPIEPGDIATVLASDVGGCKDVPEEATTIGHLNMVDTEEEIKIAQKIASNLVDAGSIDRVVLTRMTHDDPVMAVYE